MVTHELQVIQPGYELVARYSKMYLRTLATCYWFDINTIQTLVTASSSQVVLECYLIVGG